MTVETEIISDEYDTAGTMPAGTESRTIKLSAASKVDRTVVPGIYT